MIVNQQQMSEINAVQYEIFKDFHSACEQLNLKYYLVHGSLLGALRHDGFFPMDDDIDVAMPRKDYEIFIRQGQNVINCNYFIQSYLSEENYPLVFSKMRANNTTFIQPVLKKLGVNQGIYIDIFPIDNFPVNKGCLRRLQLKSLIFGLKTSEKLAVHDDKTFIAKTIKLISRVVLPSWKYARNVFCELYNDVPETGYVIVRGGKQKEKGIPADLFGNPTPIKFEDISAYAPERKEEYLHLIYGDYLNYEPMGKDMVNDHEVKISAEIIDVHKSYKEYLEKI